MTTALAITDRVQVPADLQEKALLGGDLSKLTSQERLSYYNSVCTSLGLNPLTRPFEYITLNNKLTLYARKDCTEQLRTNRCISVEIKSREVVEGIYVVTAKATEAIGGNAFTRCDEAIGAVAINNVQGDARANAMMKAETKAKRRVTLSICGLGMLDETEIETIPGAKVVHEAAPVPPPTAPALESPPAAATDSQVPTGGDSLIIWNAGKTPDKGGHRGKDIRDVPGEYLVWYEANGPQDEYREKARLELDRRDAAAQFAQENGDGA